MTDAVLVYYGCQIYSSATLNASAYQFNSCNTSTRDLPDMNLRVYYTYQGNPKCLHYNCPLLWPHSTHFIDLLGSIMVFK